MSTQGYKTNSPDVDNLYNTVPSGNITMKGVELVKRVLEDKEISKTPEEMEKIRKKKLERLARQQKGSK